MVSLQTRTLRLSLDPTRAAWSLSHLVHPDFALTQAQLRLHYSIGRQNHTVLDTWSDFTVHGSETSLTPLGNSQTLRLISTTALANLKIEVEFALPDSPPCLLWKIRLHNLYSQPLTLVKLELIAAHPATVTHLSDEKPATPDSLVFFSNGWQSWSYAGSYRPQDRYRHTRLGFLHRPMVLNRGTPVPTRPGHFASDMFGVLGSRASRRAWLAGFLSQCQHFGSLEARLDRYPPALHLWANGDHTRLDPGQSIETDWACLFPIQLDDPDPLADYALAVARTYGYASTSHPPLSGWCSWYHYYQKVRETDVLENVQAAQALRRQLPIELIQLDDGFEPAVGDWLSISPNFPQGMAPLAAQIESAGFTPGLWLAPFIVDPRSTLAHAHPDWLLRSRFNRPVNAGYTFWGTFATGLDLTHPAALDYAAQVTRTAAREWGYPFLKLDFLYAAALPGRRRDPTRTSAQVLRAGLGALRQAAGEDCFLLGCGCPLGSAIGLVDGMRISSDTSEEWEPSYAGIHTYFRHEPDFPSARNATHNSLTRLFMHQRWWLNDPDVLLPNPDLPLSDAEFETLATVTGLTGGLLLVSGQLSRIPAHRLRQWSSLLPLINQRPRLPDWMDSPTPRRLSLDLENSLGLWRMLAFFNWSTTPEKIDLDHAALGLSSSQPALTREFWTGQLYPLAPGAAAHITIPAHGVRVFALRSLQPGVPIYLGSDLHISQGLEVSAWRLTQNSTQQTLEIRLERPGIAQGSIDLYLPGAPTQVISNHSPLEWSQPSPGCYRFSLDFDRIIDLQIQFSSPG